MFVEGKLSSEVAGDGPDKIIHTEEMWSSMGKMISEEYLYE
jgi:hypothetical protein